MIKYTDVDNMIQQLINCQIAVVNYSSLFVIVNMYDTTLRAIMPFSVIDFNVVECLSQWRHLVT